jgi:hypothetical protein
VEGSAKSSTGNIEGFQLDGSELLEVGFDHFLKM